MEREGAPGSEGFGEIAIGEIRKTAKGINCNRLLDLTLRFRLVGRFPHSGIAVFVPNVRIAAQNPAGWRTTSANGGNKPALPVVLSTRVPAGRVFGASKGSVVALRQLGCVLADHLSPQKGTILLMLALTKTQDPAALQKYFDF